MADEELVQRWDAFMEATRRKCLDWLGSVYAEAIDREIMGDSTEGLMLPEAAVAEAERLLRGESDG